MGSDEEGVYLKKTVKSIQWENTVNDTCGFLKGDTWRLPMKHMVNGKGLL